MKRPVRPYKEFGRYGSVGIELVLSIMLGWYAGRWLDGKIAGGHGWLTALGFVFGTYAGFRALFVAASHMQKDIERAERAERGEDPWGDSGSPSTPDQSAPNTRPNPSADHDDEPHDDR